MPLLQRIVRSPVALIGLLVLVLGCLPLALYIVFGPPDGNPIGLGLLAFVSMLLGIVLIGVGTLPSRRRP